MKCSFSALCFHLILFLLLGIGSSSKTIQEQCKHSCQTDECQTGCELLQKGLHAGCGSVCNQTRALKNNEKSHQCTHGCRQAVLLYFNEKKRQLGVPPPPKIVPNSITNTSVGLEWTSTAVNLTYLVQWQLYSQSSNKWTYYKPDSPTTATRLIIDGLTPQKSYVFRLAYLVSSRLDPIFSAPTNVITTQNSSVRQVDPIITNLTATNPNQIVLSWVPPSGPASCILYLNDTPSDILADKEISLPNVASVNLLESSSTVLNHTFKDLKPNTLYTVAVSCTSNSGIIRRATSDVQTKRFSDGAYLIVASEKQLYYQVLDISKLSVSLHVIDHNLKSKNNITALGVHVARELIFFADTSGAIQKLSLTNGQVKKIVQRQNITLTDLSVDWIYDKIYTVENLLINSYDLNGTHQAVVVKGFPRVPRDLQVEPNSRCLYWLLQEDEIVKLYRLKLNTFVGDPLAYNVAEVLYSERMLSAFTLDVSEPQLYFPRLVSATEHSIMSLDLDGHETEDIRENKTYISQFKGLKKIIHVNSSFYWINGRELYVEEYHPDLKKLFHNSLTFPEPLVAVQMFHCGTQPRHYKSATNLADSDHRHPRTKAGLSSTRGLRGSIKGKPPPAPQHIWIQGADRRVGWTRVDNNDSDIIQYFLYQKDKMDDGWHLVYQGLNNFWDPGPSADYDNKFYTFKVRARNSFGMSDFSDETPYQKLMPIKRITEDFSPSAKIVYGISFLMSALLLLCCFIIFKFLRTRKEEKKMVPNGNIVQLPELPGHPHENNVHYLTTDIGLENDLSAIPKIPRDQIAFTKFLGSGAFAKVYEGVAQNLGDVNSQKVAIKTLRSSASLSEKSDFLKEAKLMGNFNHPHIIKLLGICLDSDPCLIFELMEGGDLLSHLRTYRTESSTSSPLTLDDLLSISIDVAEGCKYLEERHYVHRDLAARNCLVSSVAKSERVVKIGDFGLARDIYKNDYYRKEGEGLLPVRWMAPESLTDGIFTTQSDIWSFGVLLWEVFTLGRQPYPARNNVEVWSYVRCGGRLNIPDNCPTEMRSLLNQCWNFQPHGRPSFGHCSEILKKLRLQLSSSNLSVTSVHNLNYLLNRDPHSKDSVVSTEVGNVDSAVSLTTDRVQSMTYLKLLASKESLDKDGYEVPLLLKENFKGHRSVLPNEVETGQLREKIVTLRRSPPPTYSQIFSVVSNSTTPESLRAALQNKNRPEAKDELVETLNDAGSSENSDDFLEGPSITAALLKPKINEFSEAPSRYMNELKYPGESAKLSTMYHKSLPCLPFEPKYTHSSMYPSSGSHLRKSRSNALRMSFEEEARQKPEDIVLCVDTKNASLC